MKNTLEISFDKINKIDYNELSRYIVDKDEFLGDIGKEHYKLLSYISQQFNNIKIVDIGTHKGMSALALSYNENNTIYSFDILDKKNKILLERENIKFYIENLFENNFEKFGQLLLDSKIIFLDIDPHEGSLEYELYLFLKNNNYNGILICDDIWYFKDMRDNFWYKIEEEYKYDLTKYGHWSGTGIVSFEYEFEKYDISNWTLVTSYIDLTRFNDASESIKNRDDNYYLTNARATLSLPCNLVIYCEKEFKESLYNMRPDWLKDKTHFIIEDFNDIQFEKNGKKLQEKFSDYREKIIKNRKEHPYYFDERNTASYYLFCISRYTKLKQVIKENYFNSTHFAWVNICIERMGFKNLIELPKALSINRNKFSTVYIDYIPKNLIDNVSEYYLWGRCSMCSGFFTGNKEYMYKVCDLIEDKFLYYLEKGYGHADEQLYSPVYFENKDLFEHYYGDYQQMITNYVSVNDNPSGILNIFIRNSYTHNNYEKCNEACRFLLKSIKDKKCSLNSDELTRLYEYYTLTSNM